MIWLVAIPQQKGVNVMTKTEIIFYVLGIETSLLEVRDCKEEKVIEKMEISIYNRGIQYFSEVKKNTNMSIETYLFALQQLHSLAVKYLD